MSKKANANEFYRLSEKTVLANTLLTSWLRDLEERICALESQSQIVAGSKPGRTVLKPKQNLE